MNNKAFHSALTQEDLIIGMRVANSNKRKPSGEEATVRPGENAEIVLSEKELEAQLL